MKPKKIRARCKHVLAILDNKIQTLNTVREEVFRPSGDFDDHDHHYMVVEWPGNPDFPHVHIPIQCCIFLKN